MTQDEKVKALIEAARKHVSNAKSIYGEPSSYAALLNALAAFEPEPELEYVLPPWEGLPQAHRQMDDTVVIFNLPDVKFASGQVSKEEYNGLRELTRVPKKPKGREWWLVQGHSYLSEEAAQINRMSGPPPIHVREVLDDKP